MGVTYELIDAPYPYLFAVYRCRCGQTESRYGHDAAEPPPHWLLRPGEGDEGEQTICPACVERSKQPT